MRFDILSRCVSMIKCVVFYFYRIIVHGRWSVCDEVMKKGLTVDLCSDTYGQTSFELGLFIAIIRFYCLMSFYLTQTFIQGHWGMIEPQPLCANKTCYGMTNMDHLSICSSHL